MNINNLPSWSPSYDCLQLRSGSLLAYPIRYNLENKILNKKKSNSTSFNKDNNKNTYNSILTKSAKKRLLRCCDILIQISPTKWVKNYYTKKWQKHKISFITLTIPDFEYLKENDIDYNKNLLSPFIKSLQNNNKLHNYLWRLEL